MASVRRILLLGLGLALVGPAAGAVAGADGPEWLAPLPEGVRLEVPRLDRGVPAPGAVLGVPLGTRFSGWDEARRYLELLAETSERVSIRRYGETYEGHPLLVVAVTSEANQRRLDEIRRDRLRLADPRRLDAEERERLARETPVVVWLGYGIHGNETSSTEAALATAYALAAAEGAEWEERLSRVVVLIDPLQNPDGRERYLAAYRQRRGRQPDPRPEAAEHHEPWPGGRGNHYLFDLNRDWAWATQAETRHRLAEYRRWEPQVFVDLHEMGARSEYFFPPPTEPVHPAIAATVLRWLDRFGRANAAAFDRSGWLYFKAEAFDLFYPGYGDSYPSLRGAVGMTYEVGGGGQAGETLTLADGSLLTLASRLARHFTASLATVATAADGRAELNRDFLASRAPQPGAALTYLWSAGDAEAVALVELLRVHGVEVARLEWDAELTATAIGSAAGPRPVRLAAGTWAVSTAQPLGRLVRALIEVDPALPGAWVERQRQRAEGNLSPEFFDVTAWSLPLAFGLEAWVHSGVPDGLSPVEGELRAGGADGSAEAADRSAADADGERVGFLIPWHGVAGYALAARLLAEGVPLRLALAPVGIAGGTAEAGALFVPARAAPDDLAQRVGSTFGAAGGVSLRAVDDSYGDAGISLGSDRVPRLYAPRAGLLAGDGVRSTSFGALWHLFDRTLGMSIVRLDLADLDRSHLVELDVLVMPDGDYDELTGKAARALKTWVRGGGILVAVGEAQRWLAEHRLSTVESWPEKLVDEEDDDEDGEDENGENGENGEDDEEPQGAESGPGAEAVEPTPVERRLLFTPGAVVATRLAPGHPLAAGLPAPPPVLFDGPFVWRPTGDPQQDVLTVSDPDPVLAGFTWPETRSHLAGALLVASEREGRGRVVLFAQDPAFRGFWRATMPLLLNAVLYGPSGSLDPAAGR